MSNPTRNPKPETTPPSPFAFDPIPEAIDAIARGEFVVVMDDESRENEGDLICAAEKVTTEGMAWMIRWTRSVSIPVSAQAQDIKFARD
jgi:3,4-dihydroxy 2-butanone 4-phosphate synthase